ncbi:hypothetical protein BDQ17DRAFT_1423665 [Cyathus striatus]|nr:hypothetical protein BDQ17DRAFT_1423665 [Cyathus striatus]
MDLEHCTLPTSSKISPPSPPDTEPSSTRSISSQLPISSFCMISPPETRFTGLSYSTRDNQGLPTVFDVESGNPLQRHPDLWFEDGSVICRAKILSSASTNLSLLAIQSSSGTSVIQSSLLHGPTSGTSSARIPIIFLHDTADDVGNLLTALYDGPNFRNNDQDDFRVVSGILRLATKYIVDSLRSKALAHLNIVWPSKLKAWDAREDLARAYELETGGSRLYPHPFQVINLAREVDAPSLLPAAFYDISRYQFTQIFEPVEDDVLYHSPLPSLSAADMQRMCLGKEAAQHTITSLIQAMGSGQYIRQPQQHLSHSSHVRRSSSGGICVSAAACRKDFSELVDLATQHYLFDRERGCCDPLYVAEELGQLKSAEFSECKACAKSLESWAAKEREKMWKLIPVWFRLDSASDISPRVVS